MTQHTAGPWSVSRKVSGLVVAGDRTIATCNSYRDQRDIDSCLEENSANATLIAAAPDLLEALEGLHKALSRMIDKHDPDSIEAEWLQHSHEAILKAKGSHT